MLINRIISIISNVKHKRYVVTGTKGTCEKERCRGKNADFVYNWNRRIQEFYTTCRRLGFNLQDCKFLYKQGKLCKENVRSSTQEEGEKGKASKLKSLLTFFSLNLLYIDLIDNYPYYSLFCLKELYIQTLNNIGVHR